MPQMAGLGRSGPLSGVLLERFRSYPNIVETYKSKKRVAHTVMKRCSNSGDWSEGEPWKWTMVGRQRQKRSPETGQ